MSFVKISCAWLYVITKYGYPPSIEDTIRAFEEIAKMGFTAAEVEAVGEKNLDEVIGNKDKIKKTVGDLGVRIVNLVPVFPDIVSFDKERRKRAKLNFEKAADVASYLGCDTIQLDSYFPPVQVNGDIPYENQIEFATRVNAAIPIGFQWEDFWHVLVDTVGWCADIAQREGLRLCVEPRVGESVSNTDAMLLLLRDVGSSNLGVVFDTAHLFAQKEILALSIAKLKDKIFYVHASDNDGKENLHLGLGKGAIDWNNIILTLQQVGYKGYIGIDIGNVPDIDHEMIESKEYLERLLG